MFYVYIMADRDNRLLYLDVSRDLKVRVVRHKAEGLNKLLYYEIWDSLEAATKRLRQLQRWHRAWKMNLITELNPLLEDLSFWVE